MDAQQYTALLSEEKQKFESAIRTLIPKVSEAMFALHLQKFVGLEIAEDGRIKLTIGTQEFVPQSDTKISTLFGASIAHGVVFADDEEQSTEIRLMVFNSLTSYLCSLNHEMRLRCRTITMAANMAERAAKNG